MPRAHAANTPPAVNDCQRDDLHRQCATITPAPPTTTRVKMAHPLSPRSCAAVPRKPATAKGANAVCSNLRNVNRLSESSGPAAASGCDGVGRFALTRAGAAVCPGGAAALVCELGEWSSPGMPHLTVPATRTHRPNRHARASTGRLVIAMLRTGSSWVSVPKHASVGVAVAPPPECTPARPTRARGRK
jgi:hypothetical protein